MAEYSCYGQKQIMFCIPLFQYSVINNFIYVNHLLKLTVHLNLTKTFYISLTVQYIYSFQGILNLIILKSLIRAPALFVWWCTPSDKPHHTERYAYQVSFNKRRQASSLAGWFEGEILEDKTYESWIILVKAEKSCNTRPCLPARLCWSEQVPCASLQSGIPNPIMTSKQY